jgi:hypothetical protein
MQRVWNGRKLVYRVVPNKAETVQGAGVEQKQNSPPDDIAERRRLAAEIAKTL